MIVTMEGIEALRIYLPTELSELAIIWEVEGEESREMKADSDILSLSN